MSHRRALLIGVPEYSSDAIQDLPFIRNDIRALKEALHSSGFQVELLGIEQNKSPSRGLILGAINRFCAAARHGDELWLCFSGHGLHYEGHDYLVPFDAEPHDPAIQDYLVPVDLGKKFEESAAGTIRFFIDACREGIELGTKSLLTLRPWSKGKLTRVKNRDLAVIFACEQGEVSRFVPGEQGFSLFSRALADTIRSEYPEKNFNALITSLQRRLDALADAHGKPRQTIRVRTEVDVHQTLFDKDGPQTPANPMNPARLRRVQNKLDERQEQWERISENIKAYNEDIENETRESVKIRWQRKRDKAYAERERIEQEMRELEDELDALRRR